MTEHVRVPAAFEMKDRANSKKQIFRFIQPPLVESAALRPALSRQRLDPACGGDISQAARGVFDVRLELIERVVEGRMPLVHERQQRAQDLARRLLPAAGKV